VNTHHADGRPSVAFAALCTLATGGLAVAVVQAAARGPELATVIEQALRGLRADLVLSAVRGLEQLALGCLLWWTAYVWLQLARSRVHLTRTEIVIRYGALIRTDQTVPLSRIHKLEVRRSPAGLLLKYGDLIVDDGSSRPPVAWHLADPD
jgi:uncharacterized membrane protein YdbT with pleckstrin-like domain